MSDELRPNFLGQKTPKTAKSCPIWSHCCPQTESRIGQYWIIQLAYLLALSFLITQQWCATNEVTPASQVS